MSNVFEKKINVVKRELEGDFPYFSKPIVVSEYTVDRERNVTIGRAEAKNLYIPAVRRDVHLKLDEGYEKFDEKAGEENLDGFITLDRMHGTERIFEKK
ncbi:unnamed protein product [Caenorhabditis auriculariae]|uniref:Uncharacterized protein n=1 Tax=Caenorhabditis auriculariae TaxID=2777116 RepID=A0A8S1GNA7_9PELO|nr:unnamed protein product [Caenorhabditis auriculariae]